MKFTTEEKPKPKDLVIIELEEDEATALLEWFSGPGVTKRKKPHVVAKFIDCLDDMVGQC